MLHTVVILLSLVVAVATKDPVTSSLTCVPAQLGHTAIKASVTNAVLPSNVRLSVIRNSREIAGWYENQKSAAPGYSVNVSRTSNQVTLEVVVNNITGGSWDVFFNVMQDGALLESTQTCKIFVWATPEEIVCSYNLSSAAPMVSCMIRRHFPKITCQWKYRVGRKTNTSNSQTETRVNNYFNTNCSLPLTLTSSSDYNVTLTVTYRGNYSKNPGAPPKITKTILIDEGNISSSNSKRTIANTTQVASTRKDSTMLQTTEVYPIGVREITTTRNYETRTVTPTTPSTTKVKPPTTTTQPAQPNTPETTTPPPSVASDSALTTASSPGIDEGTTAVPLIQSETWKEDEQSTRADTTTDQPSDTTECIEDTSLMPETDIKIDMQLLYNATVMVDEALATGLGNNAMHHWTQLLHILNSLDEASKSAQDEDAIFIELKNIAVYKGKAVGVIDFPPTINTSAILNISWNVYSKIGVALPREASQDLPGLVIDYADPPHYYVIVFKDGANLQLINAKAHNSTVEGKELQNYKIVSEIIFFNITQGEVTVDRPLYLNFTILATTNTQPECVYLDMLPGGLQIGEGNICRVVSRGQYQVTCACEQANKLFAVLVRTTSTENHLILFDWLSIVGSCVCMAFLLVTLIIYIITWRHIKSDHFILNINISVFLIIGNLVFIFGINETGNRVMCTVIAAGLHFLFLVVFFSLLGQGLVYLKSGIKQSNNSIIRHALALAYGCPLIIVTVSIATVVATKSEGFGNTSVCWVSIGSGIFWAFVIPALFTLVINLSVLVMSCCANTKPHRLEIISISVLNSITCLTWALVILYLMYQIQLLQYLYAALNASQGFYMFVFQCILQSRVRAGFVLIKHRYKPNQEDYNSLTWTFSVSNNKSTQQKGGHKESFSKYENQVL
ncbi:adhesion G-protein coupled receptor G2-like [Physella acuta]|uniref:adhesion G-protein coupled receptor G2-like n=1 Tax=Physella acuta TaxID=109671 RepID=UPI0027DD9201|nr:adhesion G-protein coupled receptor G2-like [Physella acuta]